MSISQDNAFHLNWAFQIFSSSNYNAECCSNIIYAVKQLQMGWFEIVNNPKTLMQLQAILQKDSQYAKINEAPVHLLANYVQAKLPNTLDDAALRAVLNDIRASIGHLSARQLEVSKLTLQDQLDFIQEQINQNLKDTVQKYKNSLKSFVQDVFKQYLQELDQLITSDLKYRIEGIETDFQAKIAAFGTQTQPVQSTPKLNSTASTIGQNNEPIVQSSLQLSQTAQKTPVFDSKPRQKLGILQILVYRTMLVLNQKHGRRRTSNSERINRTVKHKQKHKRSLKIRNNRFMICMKGSTWSLSKPTTLSKLCKIS
ncbi:Hypothetical_protein [Hexamita inflata]|uniref:Hypothetical_protein n=1 Tax=Hexamita inflata TaxID=28002 RepID=A0AA86NMH5_9EUKA|nr:Hypothetical protein HINF_LOCUS9772 [Hexamita inflata]